MAAMYRLFTAIALPEIAEDSLSQLQSGLDGARWVPEGNFHLTLQFIGDADRHGLEDVHSALVQASAPGFDVALSACGYFGDAKPRAVWAGVAPNPGLHHLQSKVATALARRGSTVIGVAMAIAQEQATRTVATAAVALPPIR